MGINGLLPLLKSIQKPCHLRKFEGQTIGIDAYGWLHRGAHGCIMDLALDKPTSKYIQFCMKRVHMLIHYGVTPYIVFDGDYLPSKAETEKERSTKRKEAKRTGEELLRLGKTAQAQQELMKAVDITPEMAKAFMEELRKANVQYVVAPYEADAQMVYLERKGLISGILSEDSDLLVFGAKVLLTKLDQYGECIMIRRQDFTACREVSLVGWADADFRKMAILSGCDYLKNAGGMGMKTAYRFLRKHKTVECVVNAAKFDGKIKFPAGYLESFDQAEKTFLYQWVFCPQEQQLVHLTSLPESVDVATLPYIGAFVEAEVARGVACGHLHPHTKEPLVAQAHSKRSLSHTTSAVASAKRSTSNPTLSASDDLKKGKPIDLFFRKRIPLAELDPNSLRLSASQQRLLNENPDSFATSSAPQTFAHVERRPRQLAGQSAGAQVARRIRSDTSHARSSVTHPAKRQRLCSDSVLQAKSPTKAEGTTSSRFFASAKSGVKVSVEIKQKASRRSSTMEFNLWSDDSVEDAMATLPQPDSTNSYAKTRKKIAVLTDDPVTPARPDEVDGDTSQMTVMTNITFNSQISEAGLTPATSVGSPPPSAEQFASTPFSEYINKEFLDLRSKFTYQRPQNQSSALSARTFSSNKSRGLSRTASALIGRNRSLAGLPFSPISTLRTHNGPTRSHPDQPLITKSKSDWTHVPAPDFSDEDWQAMESTIASTAVEPVSSEIIPVTPAKNRPVSPFKRPLTGSEDLLIPDSEGEDHTDGERRSSGASLPFDVAKFAFVSGS